MILKSILSFDDKEVLSISNSISVADLHFKSGRQSKILWAIYFEIVS